VIVQSVQSGLRRRGGRRAPPPSSGVRFSTEQPEVLHTDPPASAYLRTREPDDLTLERLKSDRVLAISAESDQPMGRWSVYRCIVYETTREQRLYVLSRG
jgi:uncharacterized protein (TIGR04141 family)